MDLIDQHYLDILRPRVQARLAFGKDYQHFLIPASELLEILTLAQGALDATPISVQELREEIGDLETQVADLEHALDEAHAQREFRQDFVRAVAELKDVAGRLES